METVIGSLHKKMQWSKEILLKLKKKKCKLTTMKLEESINPLKMLK